MSTVLETVHEYMTPHVVSVAEHTDLEEVLKKLRGLDVSCVLVTKQDGSPAGVVSLTDLARVSQFEAGPRGPRGPLAMMPPNSKAKDIMRTPVATVAHDAPVGEAARKMLQSRVHRLFVERGGKIVGVLSTRDAMRVVLFRRIETPIREVMSKPVETIGLGDPIEDAIAKLEATNVRGLVVLDGDAPIGIFTQMEAIWGRALAPALRRQPVEEIMSYETLNLDGATPLYRAAGHAIATKVRRILVVDGRQLVGIVTGYDLAQVLA